MFDVCVIGGGPAGAALALRLARLGRSVIVIEKRCFPRRHIGESLTGGVRPLLDALELLPEIEAGGFLQAPRATVIWAGHLNARDTHGGYQVDRGIFDAILLHAARVAGVTMKQPARVLDVRHTENWSIVLEGGEVVHARMLAETAGRSRILGGRKILAGAHTLAMYSYWTNVDPEDGDTLVEAGASQWYWGAPLPGGDFNATVFVDRENAQRERYFDLIRQSRFLSRRLAGARCGEISVCDATSFLDQMPVTDSSIKAGDSVLTIDPLSSQGVQTALGTALHAAVVINTILDRPEHAELAMDFYRRRVTDSARFHARVSAQSYHEQWQFARSEFWRARAVNFSSTEKHPSPPLSSLDQYVCVSGRATFIQLQLLQKGM